MTVCFGGSWGGSRRAQKGSELLEPDGFGGQEELEVGGDAGDLGEFPQRPGPERGRRTREVPEELDAGEGVREQQAER